MIESPELPKTDYQHIKQGKFSYQDTSRQNDVPKPYMKEAFHPEKAC
jgi:hypothetical protein